MKTTELARSIRVKADKSGPAREIFFHYIEEPGDCITLWVGDLDGWKIYKPFRQESREAFEALTERALFRIYRELYE